ncbi:methylenetetrahydrofolate dehydrogenase [Nannochloropsis oceanica]
MAEATTTTAEITANGTAKPGPAVKIDVTEIAKPYREEVRTAIRDKCGGVGPKLVAFLANTDPYARQYAEWTGRACEADGIRYELRIITENELEEKLYRANEDPSVHGILIYYPVFGFFPSFYGGSMDDYLRDSVSFKKDVEGLSFTYRFNLYRNIRFMDAPSSLPPSSSGNPSQRPSAFAPQLKCLLPCTALSVVKILETIGGYNLDLPIGERMKGKVVSIINRSEIVGRPLGALLANDGADIFSVDIDSIYHFRRGQLLKTTETPESAVRRSDVIVCGVPVKSYKLPTAWVKPGAIVVNVASYKNVNEEELLNVPGVKYVPLVGKVTIAMLERNLIRLYEQYHAEASPGKDFKYVLENRPPMLKG